LERAVGALRKLSCEVEGILGISEPEIRQIAGNTNVVCLLQRLDEAREVVLRCRPRGVDR